MNMSAKGNLAKRKLPVWFILYMVHSVWFIKMLNMCIQTNDSPDLSLYLSLYQFIVTISIIRNQHIYWIAILNFSSHQIVEIAHQLQLYLQFLRNTYQIYIYIYISLFAQKLSRFQQSN